MNAEEYALLVDRCTDPARIWHLVNAALEDDDVDAAGVVRVVEAVERVTEAQGWRSSP